MSDKKTVKKKKKTNPNLRLIKNGDVEPSKKKKRRVKKHEEKPEKLRFGKLLLFLTASFIIKGKIDRK